MKKYSLKAMIGMAALLACSMGMVGCEGEDSDSDITATSFKLDRELLSYDGTDNYTWDTTLAQARFQITIADFRAGDAIVQVFDSRGKLILRSILETKDYTLYLGDNEFVRTGQTEVGTPGAWTVQLSYDQFTGDQTIVMN
jgi:hypothetical protein